MTGQMQQTAAITAFGNRFLQGDRNPDIFPSNPVFQFCKSVTFTEQSKGESWEDPDDWFNGLRKKGHTGLKLLYFPNQSQGLPERHEILGTIAGQGVWVMKAEHSKTPSYWQGHWQAENNQDTHQIEWTVTYLGVSIPKNIAPVEIEIDSARKELSETLKDLIRFCDSNSIQHWQEVFTFALETLASAVPHFCYGVGSILPQKDYSIEARQLLYSAGNSWVFGGMGSWTDTDFSDTPMEAEYLKLTQRLSQAITHALIASVNHPKPLSN